MVAHGLGRVLLALGALLALAVGAPLATATPAAAATPTYTWTGFDANLGTTNWSSGANWLGGVAPTAPGPVSLVFPAPVTCTTATCGQSLNDIPGLVIEHLTVSDRPNLEIGGEAITLTGGVSIAGTSGVSLMMPIELPSAITAWTVVGSSLSVRQVSGPGHLDISLAEGSRFESSVPGVETDSLLLHGADPGAAPADNGTVEWDDGAAATAVHHLAFESTGGFVGSHFATEGADVTISSFFFRFLQADLTVGANGVLDPATTIHVSRYTVPGPGPIPTTSTTHLTQLHVLGSLLLNSAALTIDLFNSCLAVGSAYPVATSTPHGLFGNFTRIVGAGRVPIPDGGIIAATGPPSCPNGSSAFLRIDYDRPGGRVVATAVAPPTISVATSHTPTVPGSPVTFTATVTPAPADGSVSFTDNGAVIAGCEARPVAPAGTATCTTSYAAPGNHVIAASYRGGVAMPPAGPSPSFTQVVVPAPTAVITTPSGLAFRGDTIQGTASDVGGPGLLGVVLYFQNLTGGPSGAVLVDCTSCGPGQTSSTWSFTTPLDGIPGIYAFVVQAFDIAGNAGPPSNVVYQIIL